MNRVVLFCGMFIGFVSSVCSQTSPILDNFRVENSNNSRVYFDSSERISGSSIKGFEISGKSIASVSIDGDGMGGYFTISDSFNFFQKGRMIRYIGGGNIKGADNNLENFHWEHIVNNITMPTSKRVRYVSVKGSGSRDGSSQTNEWTWNDMLKNYKAGDLIHVRSGNYGNISSKFSTSGTSKNPVTFQGYKNKPGDIKSLYWNHYKDGKFNPNEMPYFNSGNRNNDVMFTTTGQSYLIFRNLQGEEYQTINFSSKGNGLVFERILGNKLGDPKNNSSSGLGIHTHGDDNSYIDCIISNATFASFRVGSDSKYNYLNGSKALCNEKEGPGQFGPTDYYFSNKGSYNVTDDCMIERVGNLKHHGHGFTFKDIGGEVDNNLLKDSRVINIKQSLDFNLVTFENVIRNVTVTSGNNPGALNGGVKLSGNSHDNIFENCHISGVRDAGVHMEQAKRGNHSGNRFINCVFADLGTLVGSSGDADEIKFEHCTFSNIKSVGKSLNKSNSFVNSIFYNIGSSASKAVYKHSNFYGGFNKPDGAGNISVNPNFVNMQNFEPKNKSLNAGTPIKGIHYDRHKVGRNTDEPTMGAVEINDNDSSSIKADAGKDQTICLGEEVTLTGNGGKSYSWDNGEKTRSIKVSPTKTTTYTLTAKDGGDSDTDKVVVKVVDVKAYAGTDQTIIVGDEVTLTATGGSKYTWSSGETTASIKVSPSATKEYSVTVEQSGCEDTATVKVTVDSTSVPVVNADAGNNQSICLGEEVTLTASGGKTYSWNNGEKTKSIKVSPAKTTTYTVTAADESVKDTDKVTVRVTEIIADAGADVTINEGDDVTLTATGGANYKWSNGATTPSITVSPAKTKTYNVTVRKNGCEETAQVKVTVKENTTTNVIAHAGEDQSICPGEEVTLTASGGKSYAWDNGKTTQSIKVSPSKTTTYTVTASDGSVKDTDKVTVRVTQISADAGANVTINEGEDVTLKAKGGANYKWNNGATTAIITVSPAKTKIYTVTVRKNGCEETAQVKVTVNENTAASVIAHAGEDQSICLGEEVTLTAGGGKTYSWSNGETTQSIKVSPSKTTKYTVMAADGSSKDSDEVTVRVTTISADAGADVTITDGDTVTLIARGGGSYKWSNGATTASITVQPLKTKVYTVTVTKNGCEDTDQVKVKVAKDPLPERPNADAGKDQVICIGESTTLTATGGASFKWSTGETTKSILVSPNESTTYQVQVSDGIHSDIADVKVSVINVKADAGKNITIAEGDYATLTASGGTSYLWSNGETTKSINVNPMSTAIYTVTVYDGICEDTDSVQVTVNKKDNEANLPAQAYAGEDITICIGESASLKAMGGQSYIWSTGDTSTSVKVSPKRTTVYTLTATRGGITNSDSITIYVEHCDASNDNDDNNNNLDGNGNDAAKSSLEMKIYPVPSKGVLNVNINSVVSELNLAIYDLNGRIVYSDVVSPRYETVSKRLDLSRLPRGIYIVRVFNSFQNETTKIILA